MADQSKTAQSSLAQPASRRIIELGLLILVALMPFHAFLSVWLGSLVGHQAVIQAWKEALTAALAVTTIFTIWRHPATIKAIPRSILYAIAAFVAIGATVTLVTRPSLQSLLYGAKTDWEFLVLFLIACLAGSLSLVRPMVRIIVASSVAVALIAIVLSLFLPPDFLVRFGYGPTTIVPFQLIGPASFGIRTPSTLGGPNQLGSFLILPLCLVIGQIITKHAWWRLSLVAILLAGIYVSYSRSAWIGAVLAIMVMIVTTLSKWRAIGVVLAAAVLTVAGGLVVTSQSSSAGLSYYLLHASPNAPVIGDSTAQHSLALSGGVKEVAGHPLGRGLGSAGPASFHGPQSPDIPENFYLQLAIETGIAGLIAFAATVALLAWRLFKLQRVSVLAVSLLGALVGISVVNLFLHGWADSSTAFVFWILAGAFIGAQTEGRSHDSII